MGNGNNSSKSEFLDRQKVVVRTSLIGIITNVLLGVFKAVLGLLSNSIAITLDAVNNLSDALSSVITIIGIKLGSKKPDKNHPLGHGRVEYISAMLVSAIVLYAGLTSIIESVKQIIHPKQAHYSYVFLAFIVVAIIVKLILGAYVKKKGEKVNSGALVASGADASFDAILSASVLACAIIFIIWGISLEAYVGVIISIFIIKAGIEMMLETLDDIIGKREDAEISGYIREILESEEEVRGAYDLHLFNYGPNKYYGSVHLELADTMTVQEVDVLTRKLQLEIYMKTGVIMTGIGVYSYNTTDGEAAKVQNEIQKIVMSYDWALQMHGFYLNEVEKTITFDVVVSFDIDHGQAREILEEEIKKIYSDYMVKIVTDIDISD